MREFLSHYKANYLIIQHLTEQLRKKKTQTNQTTKGFTARRAAPPPPLVPFAPEIIIKCQNSVTQVHSLEKEDFSGVVCGTITTI